jgi:predicted phosphodiesterase
MGKKAKNAHAILKNTEIVHEYLEKFPEAPSKTLARKIYNENTGFFSSLESAYSRVRYYRGQQGKRQRESMDNGSNKNFKKELKTKVTQTKLFLPESHTKVRNQFTFPTGCMRLGIFGDVHIPFHDNTALETMFTKFEEENVDSILINGDLLDFYQLSFHEKDPRVIHFKDEIEAGKEFLAYLRDRFPGIPIYYITGNHENRFERYLRIKASELLDMDEFRLDVILHVAEYRIEFIPFRSKVVFGDYTIEHGDKIPGAGGVVPARTLLMRLKSNSIVNHFHKSSESSQRVYGIGEPTTIKAYSLGCMCDLAPEYMEINEWNHGFAILKRIKDKVSVTNYKIEGNIIL